MFLAMVGEGSHEILADLFESFPTLGEALVDDGPRSLVGRGGEPSLPGIGRAGAKAPPGSALRRRPHVTRTGRCAERHPAGRQQLPDPIKVGAPASRPRSPVLATRLSARQLVLGLVQQALVALFVLRLGSRPPGVFPRMCRPLLAFWWIFGHPGVLLQMRLLPRLAPASGSLGGRHIPLCHGDPPSSMGVAILDRSLPRCLTRPRCPQTCILAPFGHPLGFRKAKKGRSVTSALNLCVGQTCAEPVILREGRIDIR